MIYRELNPVGPAGRGLVKWFWGVGPSEVVEWVSYRAEWAWGWLERVTATS